MMKKNKIVSFGEILLRFTPQQDQRITEATGYDCCYGGSEANVMIALASLGNETSYVTILPDNELGKAASRNLHRYEVRTDHILFQGDVLGSYYMEPGHGELGSKVIYNRKYSEIARVGNAEKDFDFDKIFEGAELFHISGITFALSKECRNLCFTFMKEAKKREIKISFDFNYRSKLWTKEEAAKTYKEIMPYVDFVFCSSKDLKEFLGTNEEKFLKDYPCEYLVVRERTLLSQTKHKASAMIYHHTHNGVIKSDLQNCEFSVFDRVGSGDAFCAGVLHSLLQGEDSNHAVQFGMAAFVMKHSVSGDILAATPKEIYDFIKSKNEDVKR